MRTSIQMVADTRLSFPMVESVHCMTFRRSKFVKDMKCGYDCVYCAVRVAERATWLVSERVVICDLGGTNAVWYTAVRRRGERESAAI